MVNILQHQSSICTRGPHGAPKAFKGLHESWGTHMNPPMMGDSWDTTKMPNKAAPY